MIPGSKIGGGMLQRLKGLVGRKEGLEEKKEGSQVGGRNYTVVEPKARGRRSIGDIFRRRSATPDARTLNVRLGGSEPPSPQGGSMRHVIKQLKERGGTTANNTPRSSTEDVFERHHRRGSSALPPSAPKLEGKKWAHLQAHPFFQDARQFKGLMKLISDESLALRQDPETKAVCTALKLASGDLQNEIASSAWEAFENHNHHLEPATVEKFFQRAAKRIAWWNEIYSNDCFLDEPRFKALCAFKPSKNDNYSKAFTALVLRARSLIDGGHSVESAAMSCITTKTIVVQSGTQDIDAYLEAFVSILREFDRTPTDFPAS